MNRASAAFTSIGKGMLGIGALAGAGFGLAIKKAADFEKTIDAAGAVLGKTADQMKPVSEIALKIGQDTKFSAQQVAGGIEELAKAGLTIEEIVGGAAKGMTDLAAAAGEMGLDQAATIAVNAMKTFALPASELSRVADSLAGAANASTLEVEDLAVSMRYAGGTARALGVSIEEFNTVLAILGDRGIRGSTAGTSLRGVLLSLSPTSAKARKKMQELGLITADGTNKFFDATGQMKDMREVMQILGDATRNLTEEQRVQAFNIIFQRRAMASALFMAEAGRKGFDKYADSINRVSAADVAAKKLDNLAGDIEKLRSNIETLLIKAGTPFQEQLREWVQLLTRLVQAFADLSPETQRNIMRFLAYTAVIFGTMGILSLLIGTVLKFIANIKQLGGAFAWIASKTGLIKLLKGIGWAARGAASAITGVLLSALGALGGAIAAHPLVALLVGLAATGILLYRNWKPFRELVDRLWQSFQRGWDIVLDFVGRLPEMFGDAMGAVGDFLGDLPGMLGRFAAEVAGAVWGAIQDAVGAIGDFIAELPIILAWGLGTALGTVARWAVDLALWFERAMDEIEEQVTNFARQLPGWIAAGLNDAWDLIWEWGLDVAGFFQRLPGMVIHHVDQLWDDIYAAMATGAREAAFAVVNFIYEVIGWFQRLPGNVATIITQWIPNLAIQMGGAGAAAWRGFVGGIAELFTFLADLPGMMIDALGNLAGDIGGYFARVGRAGWRGFRDAFFGSPKSKIQYALEDLLTYVGTFDSDMGREMAKLHDMTFDKLGGSPVATLSAVGAGAGVGSSGASDPPPPSTSSTAPAIGELVIHNPRPEAAEDTLYRRSQELAYLGVFG